LSCVCVRPSDLGMLPASLFFDPATGLHFVLPRSTPAIYPFIWSLTVLDDLPCQLQMGGEKKTQKKKKKAVVEVLSFNLLRHDLFAQRDTSCTFPLFPRYMTDQPCQHSEYPTSSPWRGEEKKEKKPPQRSGPAREDHVSLFWCKVWEDGGLEREWSLGVS